jgi:hypothetical protein
LPGAQPLNGLAGDLGYYLEVLIEVQDGESIQLGGRRAPGEFGNGTHPIMARGM